MKINHFLSLSLLTSISLSAFANPSAEDIAAKNFEPPKNQYGKTIYPFSAPSSYDLLHKVRIITEDRDFIKNFNTIQKMRLDSKSTTSAINPGKKPWMSTYWPLNKGLIADPYKPKMNLLRVDKELTWTGNYKRLTKRIDGVHAVWRDLENEDLDELAPSEKYDILLGDDNFTLTNKVRKYMHDWGDKKENAFLSGVDKVGQDTWQLANNYVSWEWKNGDNIPFASAEEAYPIARKSRGGLTDVIADYLLKEGKARTLESALRMARPMAIKEQSNYVVKEKSSLLATWEGICHGWSTAAGIVPRPRKTVEFKLENGKTLRFFPDDLKALASYMWANSLVQDGRTYDDKTDSYSGGGILMEGLRCNDPSPKKDPWGRFYDATPDAFSDQLEPRCVGVHPAIWHLGLVNIIGKQGRSFVVERKIKEGVDNHPMYAYKSEYFNPYTGKYEGSLGSKIQKISLEDQFRAFRNPETTHIIGVRTTMTYINWKRPQREETDDESKDEGRDIEMLYDLELNANGDIVGGQWRATETGRGNMFNAERTQPDFFWVVTKDWKGYFKGRADLPEWKTGLPPAEFKEASVQAANQKYYSTPQFNWFDRCELKRDKKTSLNKNLPKYIKANCEHIYDKPQPLIQVVNKLIDLAQ